MGLPRHGPGCRSWWARVEREVDKRHGGWWRKTACRAEHGISKRNWTLAATSTKNINKHHHQFHMAILLGTTTNLPALSRNLGSFYLQTPAFVIRLPMPSTNMTRQKVPGYRARGVLGLAQHCHATRNIPLYHCSWSLKALLGLQGLSLYWCHCLLTVPACGKITSAWKPHLLYILCSL